MSWYRIYRPQTVSGLHITSVRETLLKMLKSGSIPQALLFTGPKGTGKTSSARIIAKILNCEKNAKRKDKDPFVEPCNECSMCREITSGGALNVVEMDGASNRRIDDIRALKEQLYMPPSMGKKSVYIIDEVHMLTKEAFNALLKMLEEPPEYVVFVFATTDPQKIPETILSRTTRVQFTKASVEELASALSEVAKAENIKVDQSSLETIAQTADGSFRDAVKLFEQLANRAKADSLTINVEWVTTHLSSISQDGIKKLVQSILAKDEKAIVEFFQMTRSQQVDPVVIHKQLLSFLHQELIKSFTSKEEPFARKEIVLFLLKQFSTVEIPLMHPFPSLPLEICAIEMVLKSKEKAKGPAAGSSGSTGSAVDTRPKTNVSQSQPIKKTVNAVPQLKPIEPVASDDLSELIGEVSDNLTSVVVQSDAESEELISPAFNVGIQPDSTTDMQTNKNFVDGTLIGQKWQELLKSIGRHNLSLEAILRSAQFATGEHGKATINVFYSFHKEQLELQRYRTIVEQAILDLLGGHVRFEYVLTQPSIQKATDDNIRGNVDKEFVNTIEEALM